MNSYLARDDNRNCSTRDAYDTLDGGQNGAAGDDRAGHEYRHCGGVYLGNKWF